MTHDRCVPPALAAFPRGDPDVHADVRRWSAAGRVSWLLLCLALAGGVLAVVIGGFATGSVQRHSGLSRVAGQLAGIAGLGDEGHWNLSDERGALRLGLVEGLVTSVTWNGELLPDERVVLSGELVSLLDADGRVLRELPLGPDAEARWRAESLEGRLGFAVDVPLDPALRHADVARTGGAGGTPLAPPKLTWLDPDGAARRADLRVGDELVGLFGQPVARADMLLEELRGALAQRLGGGDIALLVRRDGELLPVRLALEPLLTPEQLATFAPRAPAGDPSAAFVAAERHAREVLLGQHALGTGRARAAGAGVDGEDAAREAREANEREYQALLQRLPAALQTELAAQLRLVLAAPQVLPDPAVRAAVGALADGAARRAVEELDRSVGLLIDDRGARALVDLDPAELHAELLSGLDAERRKAGVALDAPAEDRVDAALRIAAQGLAHQELPVPR